MGKMDLVVFIFLVVFAIGLGLTVYPDRPTSVFNIGTTLLIVGAVVAGIAGVLKKFVDL